MVQEQCQDSPKHKDKCLYKLLTCGAE